MEIEYSDRIEYADRRHNRAEPEEVTWARTMADVRKKAENYEKRAAILRAMGKPGEADEMKKKADELRREVCKMKIRGRMGVDAVEDTRNAREKMLQIEMG